MNSTKYDWEARQDDLIQQLKDFKAEIDARPEPAKPTPAKPKLSPWLAFGVGCGVGAAVAVGLMSFIQFTPFG